MKVFNPVVQIEGKGLFSSDCIIYTRYRPFDIDHSYVMHSFILKGDDPPICILCDELVTLDHILLYCSGLIDVRETFFTANSVKVLQNVPLDCIFMYL